MQTMRFLILAIAVLSAFACAPTMKTGPPPKRPSEAPALVPMLERARTASTAQNETSAKLETKVEALRETTKDLRQGIAVATAETSRLMVQKTATEAELAALWGMMTNEEKRVEDLVHRVEESQALATKHRVQRIEAEHLLAEATTASAKADAETATLRDQHDAMAATIESARAVEAKLQDSLTAAEKKAAVGSYLKGIVWAIGIFLFLAAALWIASRWKPI